MIEPITSEEMAQSFERMLLRRTFQTPARQIIADTCHREGVTIEELRGPSRKRPLVWIRQDLMAEIQRCTKLSGPSIGKLLDRHYSTVYAGIQASNERARWVRQ